MTGMRKIIAVLGVDDDLAIEKDLGTIDFLEKELASIEGVYLQEAKILDEEIRYLMKIIHVSKTLRITSIKSNTFVIYKEEII